MGNDYTDILFSQIRFAQIMSLVRGRLSTKVCLSSYGPHLFPKSTLRDFWLLTVLHYLPFFILSFIWGMLVYAKYTNS